MLGKNARMRNNEAADAGPQIWDNNFAEVDSWTIGNTPQAVTFKLRNPFAYDGMDTLHQQKPKAYVQRSRVQRSATTNLDDFEDEEHRNTNASGAVWNRKHYISCRQEAFSWKTFIAGEMLQRYLVPSC